VTSGFFLWLITTLLFLVGGISDKLVCQTLEDPSSSEIYNATSEAFNTLLHNALSLDDIENVTFDYAKIIDSCSEDKSIYTVFNLSLIYDINELTNWKEDYNISDITEQAMTKIDDGITELVNGLTIDPDIKDGVNKIADQFTELTGQILDGIKGINISKLVPEEDLDKINKTITTIKGISDKIDAKLEDITTDIDNIKFVLTNDVTKHLNNSIDFIVHLNSSFIYGDSCDISCAVTEVLDLADNATAYINITARANITSAANVTIDSLLDLGKKYIIPTISTLLTFKFSDKLLTIRSRFV
jgi:hypothetical protein